MKKENETKLEQNKKLTSENKMIQNRIMELEDELQQTRRQLNCQRRDIIINVRCYL